MANAGGVKQRPSRPKFRVGLGHGSAGVNAGDADFENYRIVIEDSSGDLLGYQAETVSAGGTYGSNNKIVFAEPMTADIPFLTGRIPVGVPRDIHEYSIVK